MKKCMYKNCEMPIGDKGNKKFCSDNCRKYHHIYLKRENDRFTKDKENINAILEQLKVADKEMLELFSKVYK